MFYVFYFQFNVFIIYDVVNSTMNFITTPTIQSRSLILINVVSARSDQIF